MKKFNQALVWLTLSEIIFNLAGYVIHAALGRVLGPEDYGRFGIVVTLTTMIIMLIGNGIPTAMSKYLSEIIETAPESILGIKRQARRLQIFVMALVTVVFYFSAPLIAWVLRDPTLTPLFQLSALIIPAFAAASFYFYYFTGLHFFRLQAFLKSARALARIIFIVGFAYWFGVEGAVSGYIAAPLAVFGIALLADIFFTHKYFPATKTIAIEKEYFSAKTLLQYAWPLTLFLLFYEFILTLDLYFVKSLLGSDYLTGIYNAAITVGRIPYYLFYALTIILLPAISKASAERKHDESQALVNKALRLLLLLLVPMVTLLIIYREGALSFFYGPAYLAAAAPMAIFALGVGFLTVFYVLSFALNGAGLVKIPMWLALFGLILMIGLNLALIPRYELIGAALAVTISSIFLAIGVLASTWKHFQVRLSLWSFIGSALAAGLITLAARMLPDSNPLFMVSGGALFAAYFCILYVLRILTPEDLAPFRKLLRR